MAQAPKSPDYIRRQDILEIFAEAQAGRNAGARPDDDTEGLTIRDDINVRISAPRGSAILGAALRAAGVYPPGHGYHAHHIVPQRIQGATTARGILERADIGIDSAENGVWLPGTSSAVNLDGSHIHQGIHSAEYLNQLTRILAVAEKTQGSEGVRSAMARLRLTIHEAEAQS
ncbi:AHH domain-containing protein [Belnapia sp. F-4-1]|uniref:AHH domain-containing protein n=1 Tax=Belnapia sp. F-4-1 TaxID=1545443 RepID=UPI0005BABFE8|nr:AHH domain-containing protein [Belnapia sp. F-4-1]